MYQKLNEYKSIREFAYSVIKSDILKLILHPGQKITELELVDRLQIGKTPVREALILLAKESLINIIPQSGSFISKINLEAVSEGNFVRKLIEQDINIQASKIMKPKDFEQCRLILHQHSLANDDIETHWEYDEKFHKQLYIYCNKYHTFSWIQQISTDYNRLRYLALIDIPKKQEIIKEHEIILNALEMKNENDIRNITCMHLNKLTTEKNILIDKHKEYFII